MYVPTEGRAGMVAVILLATFILFGAAVIVLDVVTPTPCPCECDR